MPNLLSLTNGVTIKDIEQASASFGFYQAILKYQGIIMQCISF